MKTITTKELNRLYQPTNILMHRINELHKELKNYIKMGNISINEITDKIKTIDVLLGAYYDLTDCIWTATNVDLKELFFIENNQRVYLYEEKALEDQAQEIADFRDEILNYLEMLKQL